VPLDRVLLKDAPILALEALTSGHDREIEISIHEQLDDFMAGKARRHLMDSLAQSQRSPKRGAICSSRPPLASARDHTTGGRPRSERFRMRGDQRSVACPRQSAVHQENP